MKLCMLKESIAIWLRGRDEGGGREGVGRERRVGAHFPPFYKGFSARPPGKLAPWTVEKCRRTRNHWLIIPTNWHKMPGTRPVLRGRRQSLKNIKSGRGIKQKYTLGRIHIWFGKFFAIVGKDDLWPCHGSLSTITLHYITLHHYINKSFRPIFRPASMRKEKNVTHNG